ncbi:MAG: LPS export ABC transporter permease LptF [Gammaproteobacteria bacterium]|jgi:lipopolysaccharide export system permease protein|nr:LPS export ABC transporter permease LptF [Gammaproteobacteria bacterium]MBT4605328.1 LPS export ABC transporter permease LptF [Thiotrichales bacterium]MBT5370877.1 LPS export ABC transporter permease LptF [Gammaproteobacteria bacterium]MBT5745514.1 LPS export ABC transporter permease LptF [Gammaproteobacteria bacterium]MBT7830905.1 LPS export ABC transporter permease LptF [Candidatus Neomarinimicrobiota bacterium]
MDSSIPLKKKKSHTFTTLERYLVIQVMWAWLLATPILLVLLMALRVTKIIEQVATGQIPLSYLWHLVWLKVPAYLGLVIPMTLFFAVILAFGRLYQSSEVTAFRAGGVDIFEASRGVRWFSGVIAVFVLLLVMFVTPWAQAEINRIYGEINAAPSLPPAGRFKPISGPNERIFYAEEISVDQRELQGVFFYEGLPKNRFRLITAKYAEMYPDKNRYGKWLVMREGRQYSGRPGEVDMEIVNFESYGFLINLERTSSGEPKGRAIPFRDLWGSDRLQYQAELQWRLSLPIMTVLLVLLAIPLSSTSPRGGKYGGMVPGVLLYLVFSNLFNIGYGWIERGQVQSWLGISWIYGVILLLVLLFYWKEGVILGRRRK